MKKALSIFLSFVFVIGMVSSVATTAFAAEDDTVLTTDVEYTLPVGEYQFTATNDGWYKLESTDGGDPYINVALNGDEDTSYSDDDYGVNNNFRCFIEMSSGDVATLRLTNYNDEDLTEITFTITYVGTERPDDSWGDIDDDYDYDYDDGYVSENGFSGYIIDGKCQISSIDESVVVNGTVTIPSVISGYSVYSMESWGDYPTELIEIINLPATLEDLPSFYSYDWYNLRQINVDANNTYFASVNGVVYSKDMTSVIRIPYAFNGVFYIPEKLRDFDFSNLNSVSSFEIAEGNQNFSLRNGILCNSDGTVLKKATSQMPEDFVLTSAVTVEAACFAGSNLSSLTISSDVTSISYAAFAGCSKLKVVNIPDSVESIGAGAFRGCSQLTNVTIGNGVTRIFDAAFFGCTALKTINIPVSVKRIGNSVFENCTSLTSVTMSGNLKKLSEGMFSGCTSLKSITIPDSVTSIGSAAFEDCTSITKVTIPDSVTSLGEGAFSGCTSLTRVTIPDTVTYIGSDAFYNCEALKIMSNNSASTEETVTIPKSVTEWAYTDHRHFANCKSIKSVVVPEGVKSLSSTCFENCTSLVKITLPGSLKKIHYASFYGCTSLSNIIIAEGATGFAADTFKNTAYYNNDANWENGVLYIGKHLIAAKEEISGTYTIKKGTKTIAGSAFSGCTALTGVTIPDSVTSIGDFAFSGCESLTSITIPDSVTSISGSAFSGCTSLTSVTIPDSVKSIGGYAFEGCTSLTSVTIHDNVTSIYNGTFRGCTSLASITIPDSVTSIGGYAFEDCASLISITIPDSVTSIGSDAFNNTGYYNDNSNWENNVLYIGKHLIVAKEEISGTYTIKNGTKTIAGDAFYRCKSLTSITIPDSVTSIGDDAFSGCTSLTSITIPDSVKSIGGYAFQYCTSLTSVTIPDSVKSISGWAFNGCSSLASITIPDSVKSIGGWAFSGCTSLTSVTIPDSVTSIGGAAFYRCTSLTSITIPNSVTIIGDSAFYRCTSLTSVTIPDSVTSIEGYAFYECTSLTSVTIPDSVTSIGERAFGYYWPSESGSSVIVPGFTIRGTIGSEAEMYVATKEIPFIKILKTPVIKTTTSTENGVKFTWSAVEDADGYTVFKLTQDASGNYVYKELATVGASTLAFTDWTAVDGEKYCYAVCAMDNYGTTSPYAEFAFTYVKPITLSTPVVKTANTAKGIKVTWNKVANAQKYVVYRRFYSPTNKRWSGWVALKTTTGLSFVDTTTKIGINYRYTVKAVNGKSASAFKSTPTIKYNVVPTVTVANASNGIKVSWSTVANATGYTVYSSTYNTKTKKWSSWKNRGTAGKNKTAWVDKSAKAGTIYKYTVRAVCGSNASSFKASSSLVRLLNPTVKAVKASNGIKVTWNKIAGAKNYKVYRAQYVNGKWSGWSGIATTNNKTFAYVDKTAKKGVYYKYTVRAVNGKSASAFTASGNVKR